MAWLVAFGRVAARGAVMRALTPNGKSAPQRMGYLAFTDYKDLIAELRKVDPKYATQLRRDFKKIANPVRTAVSQSIPKSHPTSGIHIHGSRSVSGFAPVVVPGRLTWGANTQNGNIKPQHTVVRLTKQKSFKKLADFGRMSIVKVEVDNAAVVMADMAGKSKKWINKRAITKPYLYGGGGTKTGKYGSKAQLITMRQHRINGQGMGMIKALNRGSGVKQSEASRWIWPTAMQKLPDVQNRISDAIRAANRIINERMKTR
jgi:hypothetical protein